MKLWFFLLLSLGVAAQNVAPPLSLPGYAEGTYTIKDFHFRSGEVLPELHLSYVTVGTPLRDASGQVRNAVLMLHGTGGFEFRVSSLPTPWFQGRSSRTA